VRLSSVFYKCNESVVVYASGKGPGSGDKEGAKAGKGDGKGGGSGKLSLSFHPKEPGIYPCTVTLTSAMDTRIYQIEGTGTAPNTRAALNFHTQARRPITQDIPVTNPTDKDWTIKCVLTQKEGRNEFTGPREIVAKKRGASGQALVTTYPLQFSPEWVCDAAAHLALQNLSTNETYEYELRGVASEPNAEEHVTLRCEARQSTSHTFAVRNFSFNSAVMEVESDLLHISGESHVEVDARKTCDYVLTIQPLQAGQVTGNILFRDTQSGHFTWYTVEVITAPPQPQQKIELKCAVRDAIAVDINLVNPMDDVVVFDVSLTGEGLLGDSEFVLAPKESATYELVFSPLLPSRRKGTVVFVNDRVGEFWYDLDMIAEDAPAIDIPQMECELGRTRIHTETIENPSGQEVVLKHRSTNKINFKVLQQRIVLPPLDSVDVQFEYSPSTLGQKEQAQVVIEHPTVGQWVYNLTGIGLHPTEVKNVSVVAQVNRAVSNTISFRNPFLEATQATMMLECDEASRGAFTLLNKKPKLHVGPLGSVQIPYSFCPSSMAQVTANLVVTVTKPQGNLAWTYRLQGIAEAPTDSTVHIFTTRAREALDVLYPLTLIGLDLGPKERPSEVLTCRLDIPSQYQGIMTKCCDVKLSESPGGTQGDGQRVSLAVRFVPLRPFTCLCSLVVSKASGGRWRFDCRFEATEPDVDDTITIESPLNKPASVAFRLANHTPAYAEFDAFFDAESAYEFSVTPTNGVLEPQGSAGTTFLVTYTPVEYGKTVTGKLIIQTEEVYWSYAVRGVHPKYTAPVITKSRLQTHLSREVQSQMASAQAQRQKKNFLKQNIAQARQQAQ